MQSGSVLLLVETDIEEWFYSDIKPWVHYVPVKADFSDLFEKIDWLRKNDEEAQRIVKRAEVFSRYHFSKD
jgi:protein glucosyltransferase